MANVKSCLLIHQLETAAKEGVSGWQKWKKTVALQVGREGERPSSGHWKKCAFAAFSENLRRKVRMLLHSPLTFGNILQRSESIDMWGYSVREIGGTAVLGKTISKANVYRLWDG